MQRAMRTLGVPGVDPSSDTHSIVSEESDLTVLRLQEGDPNKEYLIEELVAREFWFKNGEAFEDAELEQALKQKGNKQLTPKHLEQIFYHIRWKGERVAIPWSADDPRTYINWQSVESGDLRNSIGLVRELDAKLAGKFTHVNQLLNEYRKKKPLPLTDRAPRLRERQKKREERPSIRRVPSRSPVRKLPPLLKQMADEEKADIRFHTNVPSGRVYYRIDVVDIHPTAANQYAVYESLAQTQLKGKFTDKVKSIRSFLLSQARLHDDFPLLSSLVQKRHRFHGRRDDLFPDQVPMDYQGKPWFSMPTAFAVPNTQMLHTSSCRNMSDPQDPSKTRNWAELDVMLYDFDLIAENGLFLNTRFRFCKECKQYTSRMLHTEKATLRAMLHTAVVHQPPRHKEAPDLFATEKPFATTIPKEPAPLPLHTDTHDEVIEIPLSTQGGSEREEEQSHYTDTSLDSFSSVTSSKYTKVTLDSDSIARQRSPLTNIVSYFTLRQSR
jgi:hypothetical protein